MKKTAMQPMAFRQEQPLRVLILTGRFGMGHCAAAEAIRQEVLLDEPRADIRVVDVMDALFPHASRRIYDGFNFLVKRCSWVYNLLNRAVSAKLGAPLQRPVLRRLDTLLEGVDLIVATMPVCSQYITAYKRQRGSRIPLYTYITDVTVHEEWLSAGTDLYFTASEETRENLIARGVDPKKIVVSGIPVRQSFQNQPELPRDGRHILMMGGGLGLIPEADALLEALSHRKDLQITVIAGRNESLLRHLRIAFPGVEAVGYTDQVSEYMRRADLVISKSGGITTFEAIHSGTPLYILRPFLIQEVGNARYIEKHGLGWVGWQRDRRVAVYDVLSLLQDSHLLSQMRRNMAALRRSWAPVSPLHYYRAAAEEWCG